MRRSCSALHGKVPLHAAANHTLLILLIFKSSVITYALDSVLLPCKLIAHNAGKQAMLTVSAPDTWCHSPIHPFGHWRRSHQQSEAARTPAGRQVL